MTQARDLPKDLDSLTALVIEQQVSLKAKDFEIEHLRLQVARLRNLKFGQSSERFEGTVDQLHLAIDRSGATVPAPPVRDPNGESDGTEQKRGRKKPIRGALPEYLPREPKVHLPLCNCPDCGGVLRKIGDVTTEIHGTSPRNWRQNLKRPDLPAAERGLGARCKRSWTMVTR